MSLQVQNNVQNEFSFGSNFINYKLWFEKLGILRTERNNEGGASNEKKNHLKVQQNQYKPTRPEAKQTHQTEWTLKTRPKINKSEQ